MDLAPEEYTRFYIVQALFKLMENYEYEKIAVTDVVKKAGVGRATFYRYFKGKEDVIVYYLEHNTRDFMAQVRYYPRCKADYVLVAERVFRMFLENKESMKLLRRAHLEYLYLDYLNRKFLETFEREYSGQNTLSAYIYSGMLFNVSMAWLDGDCARPPEELARLTVDAVYFE